MVPDKPTDARKIATPIGAALGLLAVRGLLPEDKRNAMSYATGAGVGGGAGFLAGTYLNPYGGSIKNSIGEAMNPSRRPIDKKVGHMQVLNREMDARPAGEASDIEINSIMDVLGQKDYRPGPGEAITPVDPVSHYRASSTSKGSERQLRRRLDDLRNTLSSRRARAVGNIKGSEDAAEFAENKRNTTADRKSMWDPVGKAFRYMTETAQDAIGI